MSAVFLCVCGKNLLKYPIKPKICTKLQEPATSPLIIQGSKGQFVLVICQFYPCFITISHQQTIMNTPKDYPCPRCQTPTVWTNNPNKPFCGERCKLIDLGAWASEHYRVPADDEPFSDELDKYNTERV